jgi:hypothetical protein
MTTTIAPERDWLNIGEEFAPYREQIEQQIAELTWQSPPPEQLAMMPALGIKACIEQLKIPKVSGVAIDGLVDVPDPPEGMAHYSLYGIQGSYAQGLARVYVLDSGIDITPLCVDRFWSAP